MLYHATLCEFKLSYGGQQLMMFSITAPGILMAHD